MDRLTLPEYELLMQGVHLKQIDTQYKLHLQAWLTFAAKAEKREGKKTKPVYKRFEQFYDYEKELKKAQDQMTKEKSRFKGIGKLLKKGG